MDLNKFFPHGIKNTGSFFEGERKSETEIEEDTQREKQT
jgi:hypothetical protein